MASLTTKGQCNGRYKQVDRRHEHSMKGAMTAVSKDDSGGHEQWSKRRPRTGQGRAPGGSKMKREQELGKDVGTGGAAGSRRKEVDALE